MDKSSYIPKLKKKKIMDICPFATFWQLIPMSKTLISLCVFLMPHLPMASTSLPSPLAIILTSQLRSSSSTTGSIFLDTPLDKPMRPTTTFLPWLPSTPLYTILSHWILSCSIYFELYTNTQLDNNKEILAIKLFLYHILNHEWHQHSHKQTTNLEVNLNGAFLRP